MHSGESEVFMEVFGEFPAFFRVALLAFHAELTAVDVLMAGDASGFNGLVAGHLARFVFEFHEFAFDRLVAFQAFYVQVLVF